MPAQSELKRSCFWFSLQKIPVGLFPMLLVPARLLGNSTRVPYAVSWGMGFASSS